MIRRIRKGRIRDIMRSATQTVRPDTPIQDLKTLFALHGTSDFAVVDGHRRLRGVVTVFDLLRAFQSSRNHWIPDLRALWGERVEDIMRRGLWTLEADDSITAAVDMMLNSNLTVIPVVEGRRGDARLIGMVHLRDVLGSLRFESPSRGRDERDQPAWHGERADAQHVSPRVRDNEAHTSDSQVRRAS